MSFEIRAIDGDEVDDLLVADQRGFGGPPPRPGASRSWAAAELDRTRVAFESGSMIGASRTYSFELTMPGGALLPVAAVSWVSVLPTHRRRGVLTRLMAAMHDDARARDESAAILTASESSIYGRFGYGVAAWHLAMTAERARVSFTTATAGAGAGAGAMRMMGREEAEKLVPVIYDRARRGRAGMVSRPDFWWPQVFWESMVARARASFVAVHSDADGVDDGYVIYGISADEPDGLPDRKLSIIDMQSASPAAAIALWRFVFGVDLISVVGAHNLPLDDPLRHIVVDGRRIRISSVNDHLWLAPLDAERVLGARSYAVPGRIVVEVRAPDGTASVLEVESSGDNAGCRVTSAVPDLVCDRAVLGMCALGGNRWSELAAAGRVDVRRPEALLLADAMFLTSPAPALLSYF